MSLVADIARSHQHGRFGGWPRPSWTPATNRQPEATVFDSADVDFFVHAIEAEDDTRAAINTMLVEAHVAEVDADAIDVVDGDRGRSSFYRDYAKALRLACRIAAWRATQDAESTPSRPGRLPSGRLDAADIKRHIDLVSYIDHRVHLVKAGHDRFVGVCPFHGDRSPSMSVWTDGHWKCFGCGAGGDVFAFVMRLYACDFREAVRLLGGV